MRIREGDRKESRRRKTGHCPGPEAGANTAAIGQDFLLLHFDCFNRPTKM